MDFLLSANTDVGIVKATNQDSLTIKLINSRQGKIVLAVLCDGMGGLSKGEVASASVINAFDRWSKTELPKLCDEGITDSAIRTHWEQIISEENNLIMSYGKANGVRLGTTVVAMLLTQDRYYILNVGDSRAYEITNELKQITFDQTFVAREIALGNMTEAEAEKDSRRNVLLQCVGASDDVYPEMFFGEVKCNAVYMLCSDGFRHEITNEEIYNSFRPEILTDTDIMTNNTINLIELNKRRNERDNITVALARTF